MKSLLQGAALLVFAANVFAAIRPSEDKSFLVFGDSAQLANYLDEASSDGVISGRLAANEQGQFVFVPRKNSAAETSPINIDPKDLSEVLDQYVSRSSGSHDIVIRRSSGDTKIQLKVMAGHPEPLP